MVGGDDEVSRYHDKQLAEEYDVEVRLKGLTARRSEMISKLYVRSRQGGWFGSTMWCSYAKALPLSASKGLNRQRQVAIRANVAPGFRVGDRVPEMFKAAGGPEYAGRVQHHDHRTRARV